MWEPGARVLDERFRIVSVASQAGFTETYVAEQLSLARKVTLQIFRPPPPLDQPVGARFDEEVRRLATVDHPAVVRVIDSGRSEETLFLVNELAEGPRLSDELRGEPLLPERAYELLTQIADGLAAIHVKGVVHGDLRPATVTVAKAPLGEQARLNGFGLTPLVDPQVPEAATVVGLVISNVESLSPERALGGQPDIASDVYAFGVLAYQALSGLLPARTGARPLGEAAAHLADQALLISLVMQCLEQEAARRPSASEVAKRLAKLPRPTEPTIFLEAMQRPPPVPRVAAAVEPAAPPPLLASVATMTIEPPQVVSIVGPITPPPASSRLPLLGVAAAFFVALAIGLVMFINGARKREARHLIERHQPAQALEVIGKALKKQSVPSAGLLALKAAALHLSDAHAEEATVFKSVPADDAVALDPLVLSGLIEDLAKKDDLALRALLRELPKKGLEKVLVTFAKEPLSARQWGALRYLDLELSAGALNLAALYSASLESNDCAVRRMAAKRLSVLLDDSSEAALNRLRDAPREGAEKNCGQDEAQAALQALKKSR